MERSKKTVVIGASEHPERYSYLAVDRLLKHGHEVVAIGNKAGEVQGVPILTGHPEVKDVDTVTLYVNPKIQRSYYDHILSMHPKRVIFNPGTENEELYDLVKDHGIEAKEACTLVMLSTGQY